MSQKKKRYVAVGAGARLNNFTERLARQYSEEGETVALCDISRVRCEAHVRHLETCGVPAPTIYAAEDFEQMLRVEKPDAVIVCSRDDTHDHYIVESLRQGIDVITEKPMATDAAKCQRVLDAAAQSPARVRVAFNYRWMPWNTKVKQLILEETIGRIHSVNLDYMLNTRHGADYFRRWHSEMDKSGGLLVHKSTHHFDLVNWWLDAIPETVSADADLIFYGRENALRRGDEKLTRYDRYTEVAEAADDPFALNLRDGGPLEELYWKAETETGYRRDRNVFRDGITIYDTMAALVRYRTGALLTYSLNAFSSREGMRVSFNGDRGRIELHEFCGGHLIRGQSEEALAEEQSVEPIDIGITVYPHFRKPYAVEWKDWAVEGSHGGSDTLLGEQIFSSRAPVDIFFRAAGEEQGAASILVGIAANRAVAEGRPVKVSELVKLNPSATRLRDLR
jgi:predicted dehydrogenase